MSILQAYRYGVKGNMNLSFSIFILLAANTGINQARLLSTWSNSLWSLCHKVNTFFTDNEQLNKGVYVLDSLYKLNFNCFAVILAVCVKMKDTYEFYIISNCSIRQSNQLGLLTGKGLQNTIQKTYKSRKLIDKGEELIGGEICRKRSCRNQAYFVWNCFAHKKYLKYF